ncbi:MAG: MarR family transcriptional regulator [Methanospirillum sp.]|nr:MarR family transcriptional regulator [Methanospirillum sp.]
MKERERHLLEAVENLLRIRHECSCSIISECGLPDMTTRQVSYLRLIDEQGEISFSRLAEVTGTSKPTVTEMINRCARMACVRRERSPDDRRIRYIRLTEKGRTIARADHDALRRTIERMMTSLDDQEMDHLIELLGKVR